MRRPAPSPSSPPSLRGRALQWLAQREHSRQELRDKLLRWARAQRVVAASTAYALDDPASCTEVDASGDAQAIEYLLDELQAAGHLSQQRFVESRIHARVARFGNRRIEQELRRLGAEPDPASRAALQASEAERARQVWQRKFGQLPASAAERARQMRFLAGRGFSADTIRRVLGGQGDE